MGIIFISHRLQEVFEVADEVTVLRDGNVVLSGLVKDTTEEDLVHAMVGSATTELRSTTPDDEDLNRTPVLRVADLRSPEFGPLSLDVHAGEVVGLYGLTGSGRSELLATLAERCLSCRAGTKWTARASAIASEARDGRWRVPGPRRTGLRRVCFLR